MITRFVLPAVVALSVLAGPVSAQNRRNAFDETAPVAPNSTYQGPQGYTFQGGDAATSHDRKALGQSDDRYSQTYQQQQQEAQTARPGGGCLRYGAVGAAGGHLAGHGVIGALAGCAMGSYVKRRDERRIEQQSGR